jgi:hypothetical protein
MENDQALVTFVSKLPICLLDDDLYSLEYHVGICGRLVELYRKPSDIEGFMELFMTNKLRLFHPQTDLDEEDVNCDDLFGQVMQCFDNIYELQPVILLLAYNKAWYIA